VHWSLGQQRQDRQANVASATASSSARRVVVATFVMTAVVVPSFVSSTWSRTDDVSPAGFSEATPPLRRLINFSVSHTVSFR
jgi:hypothetical protein